MSKGCKKIIIVLLPFIIIPLVYIGASIYRKYSILVFPCPIRTFWGIYCPGCGGTRCMYALLKGNIIRALRCNVLFVTAMLLAVLFWLETLFSLVGKSVKLIPRSRTFIIAASGIAVAYIILRNFIPIIAPV